MFILTLKQSFFWLAASQKEKIWTDEHINERPQLDFGHHTVLQKEEKAVGY